MSKQTDAIREQLRNRVKQGEVLLDLLYLIMEDSHARGGATNALEGAVRNGKKFDTKPEQRFVDSLDRAIMWAAGLLDETYDGIKSLERIVDDAGLSPMNTKLLAKIDADAKIIAELEGLFDKIAINWRLIVGHI